jgi:pimeloyl-ACP methyl ester carboxylesterase
MLTVVLVHGFWHGSWCWSPVTEQLAGRGVPSVAVDLDGHGLKSRSSFSRWGRPFDPAAFATEPSGVAAVTATSAAAALVRQLEVIGGGEPCVVAAHSMGGTVATAAAELAPELFAHLVYVTAFAPVSGQPAGMYIGLPECAASMVPDLHPADPAVIGALRIDTGDRDRHAAIREAFYGDVDEVTATAAISLLSPDAPVGIAGEAFAVTPGRYGAIPHTYVTCAKDNAIPIALQRRFIEEINAISGTPTAVVELDSSHSPFLSQPAALATPIAELARREPAARPGPGHDGRELTG